MTRVSVASQPVVKTGLVPAFTAPTSGVGNGDIIDTGRVVLVVNNAGGSSITVTALTPITVDGLNLEDLVVTVAAGAVEYLGPFSASTFGQPTGSADAGRAYVEYSSVTSVTRAVLSV